MDIKPYDKTIRDLLGSKRQFIIPRFQREYSWDKKNYQEFLEDMINNLVLKEGRISSSPYFLGTMLFIGNFTEGTEQEIQVVDGQQRLTTITILFSAISDRFKNLAQETLSRQLFSYIMTEDDNGEQVRILKTKTSHPFFSYFIQDKDKDSEQAAYSEEEHCIKDAYDYFKKQLTETKLKNLLKRKHTKESVDKLSEVDILKAIRDQVLNSTFVSISTTDKSQANKIFEILNAKGKRLTYIDLIKNKIFEVLNSVEPADFAEESWKEIKEILNSGKENVGMATFFHHYWSSKYKKVSSNKLYDDFTKTIKTKEQHKQLVNDLIKNAKNYMKIVNPKREDYNNKKEYFALVQSLNCINNYFNVIQARIALLALFDAKSKNIITTLTLKNNIQYIENFHFAYNTILKNSTNSLEKIYSSFAINIRNSDKSNSNTVIKTFLVDPLEKLFPEFEDFSKKFIELSYSKKDNSSNIKTKYALNKINNYFYDKEVFIDDGSIEHIISEKEGDYALNIGNLILLEQNLNSEADDKDYNDKKSIYLKSSYPWVKKFINEYSQWDKSMIEKRAKLLSQIYYTKVFKKSITTSK